MQFVNFEEGCAPEGLTIAEVDAPVLTDDKVLVQVHAFGVNRADTLQRQGKPHLFYFIFNLINFKALKSIY